jgi:hypothetical protein
MVSNSTEYDFASRITTRPHHVVAGAETSRLLAAELTADRHR